MIFHEQQIQAITHERGPAMVIAGPGSGKTMVITRRLLFLLDSCGVDPAHILVVTFTKAAAVQMRERFRKLWAEENARGRGDEPVQTHVQAQARTQIPAGSWVQSSMPGPAKVDGQGQAAARAQAPPVAGRMSGGIREWAQVPPVTFGTFHSIFFQILKLAYGYSSDHIIREETQVAWIRELAAQAQRELVARGAERSQDKATSGGMGRNGAWLSSAWPMPRESGQVQRESARVQREPAGRGAERSQGDDTLESDCISPRDILAEVSLVKGEMMGLGHYYPKSCSQEVFGAVYQGYEERLRRENMLDFDDMMVMCHRLFAQRADILAAWQEKFRYILVDEFQDINRVQYDVVRMLALPENNLFAVGDDDQSIYRFRGAKPDIMLGFGEDYPNARMIPLGVNFRCHGGIVAAAGRLIAHNKMRYPKEITAASQGGKPPVFCTFSDNRAQAHQVAQEIRDYARMGVGYGDIALLFRTNQDSRLMVERLMEYNIPFVLKDSFPSIYDHWVAKDILAYVRLAMGERERGIFMQIANRPNRYLGRDGFRERRMDFGRWKAWYENRPWISERIDRLEFDLGMISKMEPYAAIGYIRTGVAGEGYGQFLKSYAAARGLDEDELTAALDQVQDGAKGFRGFADWMASIEAFKENLRAQRADRRDGGRESGDGVALMTMHGAKGLEYRVVYILDAVEGVTPHRKAALGVDLEEERRLFYVAMTRAKERLHIYAPLERYGKKQDVSRFLGEALGKM
ncbi:MAG: ATP-dependent helicase [Lachnospiraceae bacterium]|jgi:DNA helicase-2/ATP-dependent DNA helicase PcrA|nr:ATP-dependent helicase [Lachnospiraceae bacterium]